MRGLWLLYTMIGFGAFTISFLLQGWVFLNITQIVWLSFGTTCVFESAKVVTIILHRFMTVNNGRAVPIVLLWMTQIFKCGLVLLSIICSLAMLSQYLRNPNLDGIMEKDTGIIEKNHKESMELLKQSTEKRKSETLAEIRQRYGKKLEELKRFYETRIENEEKLRDQEFDRKVNGIRKGERWFEHERKIGELQKAYDQKLSGIHKLEKTELSEKISKIEDDFKFSIQAVNAKREQEFKKLRSSEYLEDDRVKNQMVMAFLATMESTVSFNLGYMKFIAAFSLMVSLLLESTIYVVFNYLTISHQEIFSLGHELHIKNEGMKAMARSELDSEKLRAGFFKQKILERIKGIRSTFT
jgi:hypothetical protein